MQTHRKQEGLLELVVFAYTETEVDRYWVDQSELIRIWFKFSYWLVNIVALSFRFSANRYKHYENGLLNWSIPCWKSVLPQPLISSASPVNAIPLSCHTNVIHPEGNIFRLIIIAHQRNNVFSRICLSVHRESHVTITHDTLDLIVQGTPTSSDMFKIGQLGAPCSGLLIQGQPPAPPSHPPVNIWSILKHVILESGQYASYCNGLLYFICLKTMLQIHYFTGLHICKNLWNTLMFSVTRRVALRRSCVLPSFSQAF